MKEFSTLFRMVHIRQQHFYYRFYNGNWGYWLLLTSRDKHYVWHRQWTITLANNTPPASSFNNIQSGSQVLKWNVCVFVRVSHLDSQVCVPDFNKAIIHIVTKAGCLEDKSVLSVRSVLNVVSVSSEMLFQTFPIYAVTNRPANRMV